MENNHILGTLGDNNGFLTCSMYVAQKWNKYKIIRPYSRFELAAQDVRSEKIFCFLVPAAYPDIKSFIMDDLLTVKEVFIEQIPPLVYVTKSNVGDENDLDKIYIHPATTKLLDDISNEMVLLKVVYVDSNIDACKALISDSSKRSVAITNKLCADYYKLNIIRVLRQGIKMPWVCFVKKTIGG